MLAITGELVVFENEFKGKDGTTYKRYSTTIGNKDQSGKYHNAYLGVKFLKDAVKGELPKADKGLHVMIMDAFLSNDYYTKNDVEIANLQLVVKKARVL